MSKSNRLLVIAASSQARAEGIEVIPQRQVDNFGLMLDDAFDYPDDDEIDDEIFYPDDDEIAYED